MGELLSKPVTETATGMAKSATLFQTLASMQGYRVSNEDSHQALLDLAPSVSYFGVFDGHNGDEVANACAERLHLVLRQQAAFTEGRYKSALEAAFVALDEDFIEQAETMKSGAAALVSLVTSKEIIVANAGDCRAILTCRDVAEPLELSEDHKPNLASESKRIVAAGGFVTTYAYEDESRLNGVFSLSRSFGDVEFKVPLEAAPEERLMSVYPEIKSHSLDGREEFMVLACDGIWGVVDNLFVANFIKKRLLSIAEYLLDQEDSITTTTTTTTGLSKESSDLDKESSDLDDRLEHQVQEILKDLLMECLMNKSLDNMTAMLVLFLQNSDLPPLRSIYPEASPLQLYLRAYHARYGPSLKHSSSKDDDGEQSSSFDKHDVET